MTESMDTLRGATRLTFDAIEGLINTVERMHETIARRPLPWQPRPAAETRSHGIVAASVYSVIRGANGALREGADWSMNALPAPARVPSRRQSAFVSAVNGVCGDHLEATDNPLAIDMHFSAAERALDLDPQALAGALPDASPHIAVFVHGLCLSPNSWQRGDNGCVGDRLEDALDVTPLYVSYNTGRHISTNGRELAEKLAELCAAWPVPVESLSLIGHSMGGLVIRSACWYADEADQAWLKQLKRVICLGTPHHGAALEKAGSLFDRTMQSIQYVDPLLLGKHRSVGIKDLRHGNLLDEDWQDDDESTADRHDDQRRPVPFIEGVDYFFAAASVGQDDRDLKGQVFGDFLVRLPSATGAHADDARRLPIRPQHCRVFHGLSHFDLLSHEQVQQQIVDWFGA